MAANIFPSLTDLKGAARIAGYYAGRGIQWWVAELKDLLPHRFRPTFLGERVVQLQAKGGRLIAVPIQTNSDQVLFDVPFTGWSEDLADSFQSQVDALISFDRIELIWPENALLVREVTLPRQVGRHLRDALILQLERLMPLKREVVHMAYLAEPVHRDASNLNVTLAIAKKADVKEALTTLEGVGLPRQRVYVLAPLKEQLVPLAGAAGMNRPFKLPRRQQIIMGVPLALAVVCLVLWLAKTEHQENVLAEKVATAKAKADTALTIRDRLRQAIAAHEATTKLTQAPHLAVILEELSRRIPDSGWVFEFRLQDKLGRISGYAPNGAALVPLLQASNLFQNVRLDSSIQTENGKQHFDLSFNLKEIQ